MQPELPNQHLINKVKAEFILRGTTLTAFCRLHNQDSSNVIKALRGTWTGETATYVCQLIIDELGITLDDFKEDEVVL